MSKGRAPAGWWWVVLCMAVGVWPAVESSATMDDLKAYKKAYPGKAASCTTCHTESMGKRDNLTAYGQALQQLKGAGQAGKLTAAEIASVRLPSTEGEPPASAAPSSTKPSAASSTDAPAAAPAEYVGTETCATCHEKEFKEFKHSTHAKIAIPGDANQRGAQGCETCHGPGSLHVNAGGGRGVGGIVNPSKSPDACFTCHLDKKAEFRLPHRHPVMEGKMSCTDCHNPHGTDARPWSATTLHGVNEACFKCHKEQRGPFVWEHEALREGCATCHKVHGSIHEKMLVARDYNLCLRCHTQVNFPTIGKRSHSSFLPRGTCFSGGCHTAVHGSNFDDHLRY